MLDIWTAVGKLSVSGGGTILRGGLIESKMKAVGNRDMDSVVNVEPACVAGCSAIY